MSSRTDLSVPRGGVRLSVHYDPDRFGRFSEAVAGFLGTATYLVTQTVAVVIWITINIFAVRLRWDPYPFILLNLMFSTQASYAAPLILLAQNRQGERDRVEVERDRGVTARTLADAEYLSRELAAIRLTVAELPTMADLAHEIGRLTVQLEAVCEHLRPPDPP
ncbi:MAG: DUF1003 domain-containing protein [Egibacteraceae bacterium]